MYEEGPDGGGRGGRPRSAPEEAHDEIEMLDLSLLLGALDDFTVRALSPAALKGLKAAPSEVVGRPISDIICEGDRANTQAALEAMRAGAIDFYLARRCLSADGSPEQTATLWATAYRFGDERVALVEMAYGHEPRQSPLAEYLGRGPLEMAVGTTDAAWVITSVSADIDGLLGIPAAEALDRRLLGWVEEGDVGKLLEAGRRARTESSAALRIRVRDGAGGWTALRCILTPLAGSTDLCFMLLPDPEPHDTSARRVARLEEHLWRIGAEIQASGIWQHSDHLPDPARFPQMGGLTGRQWEVLRRLKRGERVPTIAKELFVSQSTVRNHLAAIFQLFGVHSQADLLALLVADQTDAPPT
jgi:DNA-binding CsgD family transcriptional regulator